MRIRPTDHASVTEELPRRPPQQPVVLGYSLTLGLAFALCWLGFAAVRAQDGRRPITDWMDPLLAGATLGVVLLAITTLIAVWEHIPATRMRTAAAEALVISQWAYISGEVLSNTITIGQPPGDIGALLEIISGLLAVLGVVILTLSLAVRAWRQHGRVTRTITIAAVVLAFGTGWWFSHPIDQSSSGAPACIPGNTLYNLTHAITC